MSKEESGLPLALLSVLVGLQVKASQYSCCWGLHRLAGESSAGNTDRQRSHSSVANVPS